MGRKGIGKLAALYLSDCFSIATKTATSELSYWKLDVSKLTDDETPEIENVSNDDFLELDSFKKLVKDGHGTIICLNSVNLKGLGEKAFESLTYRLASLFLYEKIKQHIWIKVLTDDPKSDKFFPIEKRIAFKNFAYVYTTNPSYISECIGNSFSVPYKTKTGLDKKMKADTEVVNFSDTEFKIQGEDIFFGIKKKYCIDGWIGIHATIDGDEARENDKRYIKNQFYNPNQLRIYVRNKLALANMIEHLGITRAFVNYIEGEISFDILDDDDLEDIATAGRQDFDTQDPRFTLLKELLTKIGNSLVAKRQILADRVKERKQTEDISISTKSKVIFQKDFHGMLNSIPTLLDDDKVKIEQYAVAQLEGNINLETKSEFTVFLSHSSKDHIFSDFIYHVLTKLGFNGDMKNPACEIFYSSSGLDTENLKPLSLLIKNYIIRKNNDILFLTSPNFGKSEFCLFEGGAAWATKSVGDYKILALDYESIPAFLTNGKSEVVLDAKTKNDLMLDQKKYNYLIVILNRLISHLNKNRIVSGLKDIPTFKEAKIPDKVELKTLRKTEKDYMDQMILDYWTTYVIDQSEEYFEEQKIKEQ